MRVEFNQAGTFEAMRAAEQWLEERGHSVGRTCAGSPRGILKGNFDIQKWRNLRKHEIAMLDGQMTGDMRNGPVTVEIYEKKAA